MIVFDKVCKKFPEQHLRSGQARAAFALENVSFEIKRGELALLTGHSGAGKSTLMRLIPALERATTGQVRVGDQDVSKLSRRELPYFRRKLGLMLQDQTLLDDRNAFDNVVLPLVIAGLRQKEAAQRVHAALERVGLAGCERAFPAELSGGEQQRLQIARAIVSRPAVLIADEPTAHLEASLAAEIAKLFDGFRHAGTTIIVSTHDTSPFDRYATRKLHLDHGHLQ